MYVVGQGHEHLGPGTSMVQFTNATPGEYRGGMGCTGQFNTELASDCRTMTAGAGLGCGCGGSCGGCGLGLFDSMDFSTWGIGEWGVIAVGAYLVLSLAGDTRRASTSVKKGIRRRRSRRFVPAQA